MEKRAHFFYALELPAAIKEKLAEAAVNLNKSMPFKSWVHPQDTHITLAFLGKADASKLEAANELIDEALKNISSFELEINHLGIFGRKDSPRIFWAGLKESASLNLVRERVFKACLSAGFTLETRPFSPHITIGRKWAGESAFTYDLLEELNPFMKKELIFKAERVVLYKTNLESFPKYEPITLFPLAARSSTEGEQD